VYLEKDDIISLNPSSVKMSSFGCATTIHHLEKALAARFIALI
jgi:hypothetical protein